MRSVPPRGSGWVSGFWISDCQLALSPDANRKSEIDNRQSRDPPATAWWYWPHPAEKMGTPAT